MQEFQHKQPKFLKIACWPFTKDRKIIQKFEETNNLKHLYRSKLDKVCLPQDAAYSDSKDLPKISIFLLSNKKSILS